MLEWYFWLPYRRVWASCVSHWDEMLSSMLLIFRKRVCQGMTKLVQWKKKCIVDAISLPHSHKGLKVFWTQCLNLCSWRGLRPRRNLVINVISRGLWISRILLAQGCMKFRSFFLKVFSLAEFPMLRSSLFHSVIAIISYFSWRDVIAKPDIMNPIKIRYWIE